MMRIMHAQSQISAWAGGLLSAANRSFGKRPGCKDHCNNFYLNWHEELILYGYLPAVTKCAEFSLQRAACPIGIFT